MDSPEEMQDAATAATLEARPSSQRDGWAELFGTGGDSSTLHQSTLEFVGPEQDPRMLPQPILLPDAGLRQTQEAPTPQAASPRQKVHSYSSLFNQIEAMSIQRSKQLIWRALYHLWILSWYSAVPESKSPKHHEYPRLVTMGTWMRAMNRSIDPKLMDRICRREHTVLTGPLLELHAITTRMHQDGTQILYAVHPRAGYQIQVMLHQCVTPWHFRPGLPVSLHQLQACEGLDLLDCFWPIFPLQEFMKYHIAHMTHMLDKDTGHKQVQQNNSHEDNNNYNYNVPPPKKRRRHQEAQRQTGDLVDVVL